MKNITLPLLLLLSMLLVGCGDPTLDASSEESLEASMEAMAENMDEQERTEFKQAFTVVAMKASTDAMQKAMSGEPIDAEAMQADIMAELDGKTADEIIDYAEEINKGT